MYLREHPYQTGYRTLEVAAGGDQSAGPRFPRLRLDGIASFGLVLPEHPFKSGR